MLFFLVFLCQGINRAKTKIIQSNTFIKCEKIEFFYERRSEKNRTIVGILYQNTFRMFEINDFNYSLD